MLLTMPFQGFRKLGPVGGLKSTGEEKAGFRRCCIREVFSRYSVIFSSSTWQNSAFGKCIWKEFSPGILRLPNPKENSG